MGVPVVLATLTTSVKVSDCNENKNIIAYSGNIYIVILLVTRGVVLLSLDALYDILSDRNFNGN